MARHRTGVLAMAGATVLLVGSLPAIAQDAPADLVAAAQEEGTLTTIALPHDWCNYGEVIEAFKAKYGLEVNELEPGFGSAQELEAVEANKDNPGPQAPDVIDVGLSFGPIAKEQGLIQPYMVAGWDTIPDAAKDADGFWYGDYYGVLAFETNLNVQPEPPTDWADLLDPKYANQVALAGNPVVSNQAILSVYAAALANGGSLDDAAPGLDFWNQVDDAGNFVPVIANAATIAQGETPVTIEWSYNALANRDKQAAEGDVQIDVTVPASGPFAGVYVQAISAYAPHPNAAKLWMEFLYSDEGQLLWLEGYCYPIRFDDLRARGVITDEMLANLPDVTGAVFPTLEQQAAASEVIVAGWPEVVGKEVVEAPTPAP
jgi:putative spermidine/putrescine transport system substrate-binding protein